MAFNGSTAGLFGQAYGTRAKDITRSRFLIPPFTVLDTKAGDWQKRKRQWISIGIQSELGRGYDEDGAAYGGLGKSGALNKRYKDASPGGSPRPAMNQKGHVPGSPIKRGDGRGRPLEAPPEDGDTLGGTSIFDPVLAELCYRWFCPPGGHVLDPFAGGSVRGIVAGELGLNYIGIDLSAKQLDANREQAIDIGTEPIPYWIHGDSTDVAKLVGLPVGGAHNFDMIMSCPPYGSLEVYSNDPRDLSNKSPSQFDEEYMHIIGECCKLLKDGSFAVFVVGDYRDAKTGMYCNLPAVTIAGFESAGLHLYNEAVLLNAVGSMPLRINKQFMAGRKLGRIHQNVLCFAKGNPNEFTKTWPPMETAE